jgi:hypothetical protein
LGCAIGLRNPRTNPIAHRRPKHVLRELLEAGRLEEIAELAAQKKRVLGTLVSLTYDSDPQIGWRAVEAVGVAASRVAENDPDHVREHLRRLLWLMSEESGGICWRAPEAMAEIVRREPEIFAEYLPIVLFLIESLAGEDLEHFRAGALRAIGRLGSVGGDRVPDVIPAVVSSLDAPDPQVRGMAVWCLDEVGRAELLAGRPELLADEGSVDLYEDGRLVRTTVSQLVRRALSDGSATR